MSPTLAELIAAELLPHFRTGEATDANTARVEELIEEYDLLRAEDLLTSHEVAEVFGVSIRTVQSWRHRGIGPAQTRVPGVYSIPEIRGFARATGRPIRVDPDRLVERDAGR